MDVPDADPADIPDRAISFRQEAGDPSGAENQQVGCVVARKDQDASERRGRGGCARGEDVAGDGRELHAGAAVEQQIDRRQRRHFARGVAGEDGDQLDSEQAILFGFLLP